VTPGYLTYEVHRPPQWKTFLVGLAINIAAVLMLFGVAPHFITVEPATAITSRDHITLISPVPLRARSIPPLRQLTRQQIPKFVRPTAALVSAPRTAEIEAPKVEAPEPELPKMAAAPVVPSLPALQRKIKTELFASEKSETATLSKPARDVQTGGFGDPRGVPGEGDRKHNTVTVASVGSFDLPQALGRGNGTGLSAGTAGTLRSAGFSDSATSEGPRRDRGRVVASGFGEAVATRGSADVHSAPTKADEQPVEIVFKPRPAYTPEARRRRVEGEVLVDVVFGASGSLRITRLVKGLGYGLDDNALLAAQKIQFRPARRDGQPYDCAALVHIVFELAK
jgi:TonB family protein